MENIVIGNIRVQLLNCDLVRIEHGDNGVFFDGDTFFVPDKSKFAKSSVAFTEEENVICFGDYELYIPENSKSLSGVRLEKNGKKVYSYRKKSNCGELPPLDKTPEVFALSDTPRITIPEGGYSASRKGEYTVRENVQDVYLLLCNKDCKKLRRLYVELTGRNEMVRLSTLGGWNSKYYAYTQEEAKKLITDYEKYDVPLDVMVVDTDWRSCENGWGYDINTKLFPDMKGFIDFAHSHGVEIMFNDHPEPDGGADVFSPNEIAYRERNLQALMDIGLDIWWYDRNWFTHLVSPTENVRWETFGLYLFDDITRNYWKKVAGSDEVYRRPVIMGNVVDIANGYYRGIADSASHRYSIQWTGDISSTHDALAQEVENLVKAGDSCVAYVNSDCGGHVGDPDKEGFVRWMQFGALSPIFRPHCTNSVKRFREPWLYDDETLDIVREYAKLRYRLLPVIYKNAYNNYVSGEPIFKSLGYEYSGDKRALKIKGEYMLGNDILIKPIAGQVPIPVDKRNYVAPVKATYFDGMELKGEPLKSAEYDKLDISLNHTPPEKGVPVYYFSARFETEIQFDRDVQLIVRSDDGVTAWVDGEKVLEDKTMHSATNFPLKVIEGGKPHRIKLEYFQAGGEAVIGLFFVEVKPQGVVETYLPRGKWLSVFDGEIIGGGTTVKRSYALREMPLFVRLGSVLPLSYNEHNTKAQKWDRLVLDWYSDKSTSDAGYIYEDDGETTAYKLGKFRTTGYSAKFLHDCNAYVINIDKGNGAFDGDRCFLTREFTVKRHVLGGERASYATVDGERVEIKRATVDASAFPLNTGGGAPDGECETVTFTAEVNSAHKIKFHL